MEEHEVKRKEFESGCDLNVYEVVMNSMLRAAYTMVLLTNIKENAVDITEATKGVYECIGITELEKPNSCYKNADQFTKSVVVELVEAEIKFRTEFKRALKFPENVQKEIFGYKYDLSIELVDFVSGMLPHFSPHGEEYEDGLENLKQLLKDFLLMKELSGTSDGVTGKMQKELVLI